MVMEIGRPVPPFSASPCLINLISSGSSTAMTSARCTLPASRKASI
jgi:hypothetical protein